MKRRKGFVSNSSTSSFLIFGTSIEESESRFEEGEADVIEWIKEIKDRDPKFYQECIEAKIKDCKGKAKENPYCNEKVDFYKLLLTPESISEEDAKKVRKDLCEPYYVVGGEVFGLSINVPYDETYVGLDWSSIGDDETGAQFKERAKKLVALVFGKTPDLETCEQAWRDG